MSRKKHFVTAVAGVSLVTYGCIMALKADSFEPVEETLLTGYVVYVTEGTVWEYNLVSGERRPLYRHSELLDSTIVQVDEASFIVLDHSRTSRMFFVGAGEKAHFLGKGREPVFFPAHGKLLFFDIPQDESHTHLYEATLLDNQLKSQSIIARTNASIAFSISDDELLFRDKFLKKYNLRTGELIDLPVADCWPKVWRSRTQEIICFDEKSKKYVFVDMDGHKRSAPKGMDMDIAAAIYVEQSGSEYVLAGQTRWNWAWNRSGEVVDLVLYDFSTDTIQQVAKNIVIGLPRNAFWTANRMSVE